MRNPTGKPPDKLITMAIRKRLQKAGNARAIILSAEMLAQMGLGEEGEELVLELVGDALLVRRLDAPRPDPVNILVALELMGGALRLTPEYREAGEDLLNESRQRLFLALRQRGELTAAEAADELGMTVAGVNYLLRAAIPAGLVHSSGGRPPRYRLNPEAFERPEAVE